jgi:hypothetical protein
MAKNRKTISVEDLKTSVNTALAVESPGNTPDYRLGLAAVLEHALTATGNYKGFRYTRLDTATYEDGYPVTGTYDETRRAYY